MQDRVCLPKRTSALPGAERYDFTKTAAPVRGKDPADGREEGRPDGENRPERSEAGEFFFSDLKEEVRKILTSIAGKALLLTDGETCGVFAEFSASPRALSLVYDGDGLPLFSMPDGVTVVLATGGAQTLCAARYFAEVRGIGCVLFPVHAALRGAFEAQDEVFLAGESVRAPLKEARVVLDRNLLSATLGDGYARILLTQLSRIECRALKAFGYGGTEGEFGEEIPSSFEGIVRENALQRLKERSGTPAGEGIVLADLLREQGEQFCEWRAFLQLSALYAAFFEKGKPRRYFTPDYRARALRAGTALSGVPTAEEYAIRAMTLEQIRAPLTRECLALLARKEEFLGAMRSFSDDVPARGGGIEALQILPERSGGLSAVIRDFGLMEWEL